MRTGIAYRLAVDDSDEALVSPGGCELVEPRLTLRERSRFDVEGGGRVDVVIVDVEQYREICLLSVADVHGLRPSRRRGHAEAAPANPRRSDQGRTCTPPPRGATRPLPPP